MSGRGPVGGGVRCPGCGKLRYTTRKAAKAEAHKWRRVLGRMDTYRCGDFWHVGHLPRAVLAGELSRDEMHAAGRRRAPAEA